MESYSTSSRIAWAKLEKVVGLEIAKLIKGRVIRGPEEDDVMSKVYLAKGSDVGSAFPLLAGEWIDYTDYGVDDAYRELDPSRLLDIATMAGAKLVDYLIGGWVSRSPSTRAYDDSPWRDWYAKDLKHSVSRVKFPQLKISAEAMNAKFYIGKITCTNGDAEELKKDIESKLKPAWETLTSRLADKNVFAFNVAIDMYIPSSSPKGSEETITCRSDVKIDLVIITKN